MHVAFHTPYVFECITKLYRQQAQVIQNHDNAHIQNIEQGQNQTWEI
jgi:hypothetical protein